MLTKEQVKQFREDGYLSVERFFAQEEVALMQEEVARLHGAGMLKNVRTQGDGKTISTTQHNLQLCPVFPYSRALRALPFSDRVRATLGDLLEGPLLYHLDQIFYKPAHTGDGTSWHTDNAYFKQEDPRHGTGMWIAVHDASVENGTMHVISRRDALDWQHERDQNSNHHIRCTPDERVAVPIELPAGGVLFFNYDIVHCTKPNTTARDRAGLAYHFHRYEGQPIVGVEPRQRADAVLTGTNASFGEREFGENLRGVWDALVQGRGRAVGPVMAGVGVH